MELVKEAYENGELEELLKAEPKYIYDENHRYKYATSPEKMNMKEDEIDPISYSNLIDGIKLYDFSLKNDKKEKFEKCFVDSICTMARSENPIEVYFAAKITYILYMQKLIEPLPEYYVLNPVLDNVINEVRSSLRKNASRLAKTFQYGGKYRQDGLLEHIKETMDSKVLMLKGKSLLGE